MAKRRLSKQQRERITQAQAQHARNATLAEPIGEPEDRQLGPEQEGLIVTHYGHQVELLHRGDTDDALKLRCHTRANLDSLIVGDRVIYRRAADGSGVVIATLPRTSEFLRLDSLNQPKIIAANIDRILILFAPLPAPHQAMLDRYLIAAEIMRIPVILIANKVDLPDSDGLTGAQATAFNNLIELYRGIGYQVIASSAKTGQGMAELQAALENRNSIFLGQSGVGKSSLAAQLLPGQDIRVGALSGGNTKGTHTTTNSQLFFLPRSGAIIDSPGIRDFKLWPLAAEQLASGFIEFRPFLGRCRFRNCSHQHEPGCTLRQAVAEDRIPATRFASYLELVQTSSHPAPKG